MSDLSIHIEDAADDDGAKDVSGPPSDRMRELLLRYHEALRLVESLAASLLDCSQSDAEPITPQQSRVHRHTAGEALAAVERGEAMLKELWGVFDIDRRLAPATDPLPPPLKHDRRKKTRKGPSA